MLPPEGNPSVAVSRSIGGRRTLRSVEENVSVRGERGCEGEEDHPYKRI